MNIEEQFTQFLKAREAEKLAKKREAEAELMFMLETDFRETTFQEPCPITSDNCTPLKSAVRFEIGGETFAFVRVPDEDADAPHTIEIEVYGRHCDETYALLATLTSVLNLRTDTRTSLSSPENMMKLNAGIIKHLGENNLAYLLKEAA